MKNISKTDQKELLDKFYNGDTSLDEEKLLETGDDQLNPEKDLFRFFESERKVAPPSFPLEKLEGRHSFLFAAKIAASLALLVLFGYMLFNYFSKDAEPVQWVEVNTETDQKIINLSDGSIVTLNKNGSLKYQEGFADRLVYLEGEAFFDVKRDEARPFKVLTGKATTEVLGTSFYLRWLPGSAKVELEVSEGKVAFSSHDRNLNERVFVVAGERAVYDEQSNTIRRFESFDPNLIAWKTKQLQFEDAPLKKLLEDAEGYFGVEFAFEEAVISNCRFSGTFDDPTLEQLLDALKYVFKITHEMQNSKVILKGSGC
ncbi:MAG: FecR domain-containing protein [Imperialibacter sp.]